MAQTTWNQAGDQPEQPEQHKSPPQKLNFGGDGVLEVEMSFSGKDALLHRTPAGEYFYRPGQPLRDQEVADKLPEPFKTEATEFISKLPAEGEEPRPESQVGPTPARSVIADQPGSTPSTARPQGEAPGEADDRDTPTSPSTTSVVMQPPTIRRPT